MHPGEAPQPSAIATVMRVSSSVEGQELSHTHVWDHPETFKKVVTMHTHTEAFVLASSLRMAGPDLQQPRPSVFITDDGPGHCPVREVGWVALSHRPLNFD